MLSTYLSFNLINRDMARSLDRIAADPIVSRDLTYFRENIGTVKTVDEFLDDYRLFSFAMKAYGLEDMTYARAFMKQVLESDLSDEESFANKLTDERYRQFAEAFPFRKTPETTIDLQSEIQETETVGLYSRAIQDEAAGYASDYRYYLAHIGEVESVDGLLADRRLMEIALEAVGFDEQYAEYYSTSFLREVLTSDLDDPDSFANSLEEDGFRDLAAQFNFQADGSLADGVPAQTEEQARALAETYIFDVPDRIIPLAAELNTAHFEEAVAGATDLESFLADNRVFRYLVTAFDLEPTVTRRDDVEAALRSDLSDPDSFARQPENSSFRALAELFNFQPDGSLPAGVGAQTAEQTAALTSIYGNTYDRAGERQDASRTSLFKSATDLIFSVDQFMDNKAVYEYALRAYGLDPDEESAEKIRRVLTSDLENPFSYANIQTDDRYRNLAAAFNFAENGVVTTPRSAQSQAEIDAISKAYVERVTAGDVSKEDAEAETRYYREQIALVESLDAFLDDSRLTDFVLTARGIDPTTVDREFLERVFTSDPYDSESFVSQQSNREWRLLVAGFNFASDGSVDRLPATQGRSPVEILRTEEAYLNQTLEIDAGTENEGVRLALYFQRQAHTITNAFDVLADPALQEVVRVALGLPAGIAQADIDAQARMIEERLDLTDFTDPEKLDKFLARFSALYDLEYGVVVSPTQLLFSNSAGAALGADMLMSLAQVSNRRY